MWRLFFIEKGRCFRRAAAPKRTGIAGTKNNKMIIYFSVNLKKLVELGRKYPWCKPKRCLNCNGCRIWGHGFVLAWFDGLDQAVEIKRCRCPDCKYIYRFRPKAYFKRFQADIETIRSSIFPNYITANWLAQSAEPVNATSLERCCAISRHIIDRYLGYKHSIRLWRAA